ncbi:MAG: 3-dehydroquinate synthase [Eubacteriales bacterium]|nr:3-dehydroquinate synthase [Eubacteriales bacterium]
MIIPVNMTNEGYDIVLERGVLSRTGEELPLNRRVLVVTDDGVPAMYAETVAAQCKKPYVVTVPQGEGSKSMETLEMLLKTMLDAGFTRKDAVVAVGGGVVGDLSAFTASVYMRGIDFYNIPTTLLSQVDSSIGGKTAVNFGGVKNVVGSFYQPHKVLIDPDTLKTLSDRELMSGLAEAIKMAATSDSELFKLIEESTDLEGDLEKIIEMSLLIKKNVVEQDPHEKGLRKVLNFGHTIGHAVESLNGGAYYHGECVAMGMLPVAGDKARERIKAVLKKYDLPYEIKESGAELLPLILHDKKMQKETVTVVCVDEIGDFRFEEMKPEDLVARV